MCPGQVGGVTRCSDHDHLLHCGQTVAPKYSVLKAFQCIANFKIGWSIVFRETENK